MALPRSLKLFLPFLLFLLFSTESKAQQEQIGEPLISFSYTQRPLSFVLKDLEKRFALKFSYSNDNLSLSNRITSRAKNLSLPKALEVLCKSAGLSYEIIGQQIVLRQIVPSKTTISFQPFTQTLRGIVLDEVLKTPLEGATVILISEEPMRAVSTGIDGSFALEEISIGRHSIKVTYVGYQETALSNIQVVSGKETMVPIHLAESFEPYAEVLILAEADKSLAQNALIFSSVHPLRADEINRFAGSRQDPSRMAANYAGVLSASDQRNDLIVRGNSPLGVLWRLEGVEIPNPNHFTFTPNSGGAFSLLNNNLLANSDFLTGAFPAEYGNRIGAVMDVQLRTGNPKKIENSVQLGLNGLEVVSEGPLVKKWGGSYLGSIRLFTFQPLKKLGVETGYDGLPQFQDGSFKLELPTPKAGKFTAWGIGGSSHISVIETEADTANWGKVQFKIEPTLDNQMYAFGLKHTYSLSSNIISELLVSTSGSQVEATNKAILRKDLSSRLQYYLRNYEQHFITRYNLTYKPSAKLLFKSGLTWQKMHYNNLEVKYIEDLGLHTTALDAQGSAVLLQGFALGKLTVSPNLDFQGGLYAQRFSIGGKSALEPRVSVNYYLTDKQRIYLAAGLHSQTQPLVYYEYTFFSKEKNDFSQPYNKLDFTRSRQIVLGYNYNFKAPWRLKAEAYYQQHYHVPVSSSEGQGAFSMLNLGTDYTFTTVDSVVSSGTGRNYGLELTAERYLKNGFYALGNLSLLQSWFTGGDGLERPTTFSVGFISNVLVGKEMVLDDDGKHLVSLDLRINYSGGRRIIPIDEERTINESSNVIYYDVKNAYLPQLRNYFRSDIRFSYQLNTRKNTHWIFAAADNFINTRNELYYGWDLEENKAKKYYQLGIFPYLGYRIQF